ncbi:hypothetical protein CHS0354_035153 [Potamilus streckersoni]|uniref:IRS-type PTB domain-containing protein n=1 Tax=Potamilus streckersoni TaxID=2493646 RepID=A0AAE0TFY1_9BIVA|nr:hypothetical protein CHS0354_035153 [Potamilus streckersoni]
MTTVHSLRVPKNMFNKTDTKDRSEKFEKHAIENLKSHRSDDIELQEKLEKTQKLEDELDQLNTDIHYLQHHLRKIRKPRKTTEYTFDVRIVENATSLKFDLRGMYILVVGQDGLHLKHKMSEQLLHSLHYPYLRKYQIQREKEIVTIETGRGSTIGEGELHFRTPRAKELYKCTLAHARCHADIVTTYIKHGR